MDGRYDLKLTGSVNRQRHNLNASLIRRHAIEAYISQYNGCTALQTKTKYYFGAEIGRMTGTYLPARAHKSQFTVNVCDFHYTMLFFHFEVTWAHVDWYRIRNVCICRRNLNFIATLASTTTTSTAISDVKQSGVPVWDRTYNHLKLKFNDYNYLSYKNSKLWLGSNIVGGH